MKKNVTKINPEVIKHSSLTIDEIIKDQIIELAKLKDIRNLALCEILDLAIVVYIDPNKSITELRKMYDNHHFSEGYLQMGIDKIKYVTNNNPSDYYIQITVILKNS